ncbi:MAG: hypothetical protein K5931_09085 [Lachnospiraceae bacterium]|nr:hypothetical protein [Lachnospiraceae bacterium]
MERNSTVKRIGLVLTEAVLLIIFVWFLNRLFMPKYVSENRDGRISREYYKEKLDTDIIFVGSSTVYSGINPIILWEDKGYTSYDRSNASQTMWTSYYMIEDAIRYNKPKLVALDVGFIKYDDDFTEEPSNRKAIDGMRLSSSKIKCIEAAKGEEERLIEYIFPVLRFHTRWKEFKLEDLIYTFKDEEVTNNGFIIDPKRTKNLPPRENGRYIHGEEVDISPKNWEYLMKIINICRENDVELFLMKVPSYSDNWSLKYDRLIDELGEEYGISYLNFDELDETIGFDYLIHSPDEGSHLNTEGAELFTYYLGDYIEENYNIPSHRGEEKYEEVWGKKSRRYKEMLALAIEKNLEEERNSK